MNSVDTASTIQSPQNKQAVSLPNDTINKGNSLIFQECDANNISLLKIDTSLFNNFFVEIEKWNISQDSNYVTHDDSIFKSISKKLLVNFLNNADIAKLKYINKITKKYEFNLSPKRYISKIKCSDQIALSFEKKDCTFRLTVTNVFNVDDDNFGLSEHDRVYIFKIFEHRIQILNIIDVG